MVNLFHWKLHHDFMKYVIKTDTQLSLHYAIIYRTITFINVSRLNLIINFISHLLPICNYVHALKVVGNYSILEVEDFVIRIGLAIMVEFRLEGLVFGLGLGLVEELVEKVQQNL